MEISWHPELRIAALRYAPDTTLTGKEASALIDTLKRVIGTTGEPFALLADAAGIRGADAEYRSKTTDFFRQHRDELCIAIFNVGPLIRVLTEMFRVGSGLQVKTFPDEQGARAWLRERGIRA